MGERLMPLHRAAREATFAVLAPTRVPAGMTLLRVTLCEAGGRGATLVHMAWYGPGRGDGLHLWQAPRPHGAAPPPAGAAIEREGQGMTTGEKGGWRQVWLERDGIELRLSSDGLDVETLIEIALSLRPAPTEPPPPVDR